MMELRARMMEFRARPMEFRARLMEFRARMMEFRARLMEFIPPPMELRARPMVGLAHSVFWFVTPFSAATHTTAIYGFHAGIDSGTGERKHE
jgi:hypothetical protein